MQQLRDQLMTEFADVFKKDLDKNDRIKIKPVVIETNLPQAAYAPTMRTRL